MRSFRRAAEDIWPKVQRRWVSFEKQHAQSNVLLQTESFKGILGASALQLLIVNTANDEICWHGPFCTGQVTIAVFTFMANKRIQCELPWGQASH